MTHPPSSASRPSYPHGAPVARRGRALLAATAIALATVVTVALIARRGPPTATRPGSSPVSASTSNSNRPQAGALPTKSAPRDCAAAAVALSTVCGVWWGAALNATSSGLTASVQSEQAVTDRRLDIVHTYHRWYDVFPTPSETTLSQQGHALMLNWEPVDASNVALKWSAIASGSYDAQIDALATRLKQLSGTVYLSFSHEPEVRFNEHGGATDFAAAFRHVHDRLRADGASRLLFVWNVMGLSDPVWLARYPQMWPGDADVDWVAWDPYNWGTCRDRAWQSFAATVTPFYSWLEQHGLGGKPFMLAEFGSVEDPTDPAAKAAWFAGIPAALTALPNLRALLYFNLPAPPANCDWRTDTSTRSSAAYASLARSAPFSVTAALKPSG